MGVQRYLKDTYFKLSIVNPVKGRARKAPWATSLYGGPNGTLRSRSTIVTQRGFTLLEIMIALAIIGTAIIAILHTVNYHADVEYNNILSTKMLLLAKEKIAEMKIKPVSEKGSLPESGFSYENIVADLKNPGEDPEDAESSDIVVLKTIIVGHDMELELSELIMKRPGMK